MKLEAAKQEFIQTWGTLGSKWGINRTMAQIHAFLLCSSEPQCTEMIMQSLNVSRGNVNMNLRKLMEWRLVMKQHKSGERKEFFFAEKNAVTICKRIAEERKKQELDPALHTLNQIVEQLEITSEEDKEFHETVKEFALISNHTNTIINSVIKAEESWILNKFLYFVKNNQKGAEY